MDSVSEDHEYDFPDNTSEMSNVSHPHAVDVVDVVDLEEGVPNLFVSFSNDSLQIATSRDRLTLPPSRSLQEFTPEKTRTLKELALYNSHSHSLKNFHIPSAVVVHDGSTESSSSFMSRSSNDSFSGSSDFDKSTGMDGDPYWKNFSRPKTNKVVDLLRVYGKAQAICLVAIVLIGIMVFCITRMNFKAANPTTKIYFNTNSFTNLVVILYVLALATFSAVLYYLIYGGKSFYEKRFYVPILLAIAAFIGIAMGANAAKFPYWYYHIDTITLALLYSCLGFSVGFFGSNAITLKKRFVEGVLSITAELFVTATTLAYAMFLMWYYAEFSNYGKVAWRAFFHPLFSEFVILIPVRFLVHYHLTNNASKNIFYCLNVVHAQSHAVIMGRLMLPAIDEVVPFTLCVILVNVMKLAVRSLAHRRDELSYKVLQRFVSDDKKGNFENAKMLTHSVDMQTDIMTENSSIVLSVITLLLLNHQRALFMFPFPAGGVTLKSTCITAIIQLGIGAVFDFPALCIAQLRNKVPILDTWKIMWAHRHTFFGFFAYGLLTMGLIGSMWMQFVVPRITHCKTDDVCSCTWMKDCAAFMASL